MRNFDAAYEAMQAARSADASWLPAQLVECELITYRDGLNKGILKLENVLDKIIQTHNEVIDFVLFVAYKLFH